ncbi:MAG: DNA repair exonuclease [Lachnospiraceae bacterium]|nr:DNA repair exonuclease [Lachnospiraceae bacterium]
MRLIHCADIHLDSSLLTHLSVQKARERNIELFQTFQRMVEYAEENQVNGIIIAGDLFDGEQVSFFTGNAWLDLIEQYSKIDFFYLRGNHDETSTIPKRRNYPQNLKLFEQKWKNYEYGNIVISGAQLSGENGGMLGETMELQEEKTNIVVLHGTVAGYQHGVGGECLLPLTSFCRKGIDYLALGHIHKYSMERLDSRGVYCYSGCLEGRGFDECGEKGFVLLDIDEETGEIESQFIPFAKRLLYSTNVDITGCISTMEIGRIVDKHIRELDANEKDCVQIRLQGKLDVICEKNLLYLQKQLQEQFYLAEIKDDTTFKVDYTEFLGEESLRGEFVRLVQSEELSEDEKAMIIRCGIKALSGEELVE